MGRSKSALQILCDFGFDVSVTKPGLLYICNIDSDIFPTTCDDTPELACSRMVRQVKAAYKKGADPKQYKPDTTVLKRLATRRANRRAKV